MNTLSKVVFLEMAASAAAIRLQSDPTTTNENNPDTANAPKTALAAPVKEHKYREEIKDSEGKVIGVTHVMEKSDATGKETHTETRSKSGNFQSWSSVRSSRSGSQDPSIKEFFDGFNGFFDDFFDGSLRQGDSEDLSNNGVRSSVEIERLDDDEDKDEDQDANSEKGGEQSNSGNQDGAEKNQDGNSE